MKTQIEIAIQKILSSGTKIVSFDYNGKRRNVTVGSNIILRGSPVWGNQLDRAIREHNGKRYLVAQVQNDLTADVKCFDLDKIENPCPALM